MFYFISRKTGIGFRKFSFDRGINKEMILNGSSEFIGEMVSRWWKKVHFLMG